MKPVKVIQLSDTHLFGDASGRMSGVDTRSSLGLVLKSVRQQVSGNSVILVTGDLTQDESRESYQWLKQQLDTLDTPYFWLAGNHDVPELMLDVCPGAMQKQVCKGSWQLLLLDSHTDGIPGELSVDELAFLEKQLKRHPDRHTLIALHHPAYIIDSLWMDDINLQNHGAFWEIVDRYSNVRIVINGHIHQEIDRSRNQVRILSAPSTAVQFKPGTGNFCLDELMPGYRELGLRNNGEVETRVIRIESESGEVSMPATEAEVQPV